MMNFSIGLSTVVLAAGLAGSVVAYRSAVSPDPDEVRERTGFSTGAAVAQVIHPGTRFDWAPCRPPARLEAGVCVTEVVRTVVVAPPPAAAQPDVEPARLDDDAWPDDSGADGAGSDNGSDDSRDSGDHSEDDDHGEDDDD